MTAAQPKVTAIIPAAGSSSRMGSSTSKAVLEIAGMTALERVVAQIEASRMVQQIIVLAPAESVAAFRKLHFGLTVTRIEAGGATRQESVRRGLAFIESDDPEARPDYVLIHDAARCLVKAELIAKTIAAAFTHKAVTAAVPVVDSLVRVADSTLQGTAVDRKNIWSVQTPQVFSYALLLEAHRQNRSGATDDASLVEHLHPIHIVEGDRANIKLTTPEDVVFARAMLTKS